MDLDKVLKLAGELGELRRACTAKEAELKRALGGKPVPERVTRVKRRRSYGPESQHARVLQLMSDGQHRTAQNVRNALGIRMDSTRACLSLLTKSGKLERTNTGIYRVKVAQ